MGFFTNDYQQGQMNLGKESHVLVPLFAGLNPGVP